MTKPRLPYDVAQARRALKGFSKENVLDSMLEVEGESDADFIERKTAVRLLYESMTRLIGWHGVGHRNDFAMGGVYWRAAKVLSFADSRLDNSLHCNPQSIREFHGQLVKQKEIANLTALHGELLDALKKIAHVEMSGGDILAALTLLNINILTEKSGRGEKKRTRKERPINLIRRELHAILDGSKTQLQRTVKPQPDPSKQWCGVAHADTGKATWVEIVGPLVRDIFRLRCPFGQVGDKLWVREAWRTDAVLDKKASSEFSGWPVRYEIDGAVITRNGSRIVPNEGVRRTAAEMPRWASRVELEITQLSVQQQQGVWVWVIDFQPIF